LISTFKANNPYNNLLLLVYGLLLKLSMFLHPIIPVAQKTDGFLYKYLLIQLTNFGNHFPVVFPVITFILLFTQAITFNKLAIDNRLFQKPNYLTAMSYLLITSLFSEWNILSAPLIVNTLLIWVWARMSGLYNNTNPKSSLFNIGIAIGISTFFYFPSIAFAILIVFGLAVTRPFKLAEWLIALFGIMIPYYFVLSWAFLTDRITDYKFPGVVMSLPVFYRSGWALSAISIVLLLSLVGLYYIQKNLLRQLVQTRKSWYLVFLYFLVAVFIPFINATHRFNYWILCAVPLSVFVAAAFLYPEKKLFPQVLHWIIVVFVIVFSYFVK
jgi:hypothetical protein